MIERDELACWLRLLESPGIGLETARQLLAEAGSPQQVFELPLHELLSSKQLEGLRQPPDHLDGLIASTWAWLQADARHQLLLLGDPDYPDALLQTADPPLLLYLHGRRELLGKPALAVVGSRGPTPQGRDDAEAFARELGQAGLVIVSGLALGIDAAAHQGGLATGTIAVVGTGLDQIHPKRNASLWREIAAHGLIVSEYSLGTPVLPPNFPRRSRIIAGLSQGCLVVEAALPSGSLITARLASEAGRDVFAIPGSIHSPLSKGCHALIRQGAKLAESAADVLEELPQGRPAAVGYSTEQRLVLRLMGYDPVSLDELQARGGWSSADLSAQLLELETGGAVARLAGQLFQRRAGV